MKAETEVCCSDCGRPFAKGRQSSLTSEVCDNWTHQGRQGCEHRTITRLRTDNASLLTELDEEHNLLQQWELLGCEITGCTNYGGAILLDEARRMLLTHIDARAAIKSAESARYGQLEHDEPFPNTLKRAREAMRLVSRDAK